MSLHKTPHFAFEDKTFVKLLSISVAETAVIRVSFWKNSVAV